VVARHVQYIHHNDLLLREVLVSSQIEGELNEEDIIDFDKDSDEVLEEAEVFSWDRIVDQDDDEECRVIVVP
jgi:hypothetical protein